jgi:MoxR-like ATPase
MARNVIWVKRSDNGWVMRGATYRIASALKRAGARWDSVSKTWTYTGGTDIPAPVMEAAAYYGCVVLSYEFGEGRERQEVERRERQEVERRERPMARRARGVKRFRCENCGAEASAQTFYTTLYPLGWRKRSPIARDGVTPALCPACSKRREDRREEQREDRREEQREDQREEREPQAPPADGYIKPSYWTQLLAYLAPGRARPVVALVGPAGNGKTTAAERALEALGYQYEVVDANYGVQAEELVGAMSFRKWTDADGREFAEETWIDGKVTRAFRAGKAVIINEFDALDPRVALALQSAFQDAGPAKRARYITLPGNPVEDRVYPAGDCPIVLTMNTWGTGPDRQYQGRNALDAATLDRFSFIPTTYENGVEILEAHGAPRALALQIEAWARRVREKIEANALRRVLSNRTMLRIADCVVNIGLPFNTAIEWEFAVHLNAAERELLL